MRLLSLCSSNKLHILLWVGGFVFTLFIFDRLGGFILGKIVLNSQFRYSKLYSGSIPNSVIILGSSRAVNAFYQPEIEKRLETRVVNLGFNGLPLPVEEVLFSDYIALNGSPRLLILEISNWNIMSGASWVNNLKPYNYFSGGLSKLLNATEPFYEVKCNVSRLYCFNNILLIRILYYFYKSDQSWINNGLITSSIKDAIPKKKTTWRVQPHNLKALKRIVLMAKMKNIRIKLVIAPVYPKLAEVLDLTESKKKIEAVLELPILDYSQSIHDSRGFADAIHLNKHGSLLLLDQLVKDGVFDLASAK